MPTVWFPVNIIGNLYVSNGMSAGNTPMEARTQALSEILERHIKFRIISEGLCLPDVPEAVIARYPGIAAGIAGLRAAGFGILVKDASLGGEFPVMNVTLLHPDDQGCFSSFGAHPRFEIALERALTELLQGRALDALAGFPEPGFDLEEIASAAQHRNPLRRFQRHRQLELPRREAGLRIPRLELQRPPRPRTTPGRWTPSIALGHDIYIADFDHLGVYACRILVPGMSEIYPVDDLEWENNSVANNIREAILYLPDLDDDECADLLETLNESGLADERLVAALIGLAPGDDTFWKDLRVGELKTLLALAIGDEEAHRGRLRMGAPFRADQPGPPPRLPLRRMPAEAG
jgi:ribosomal protein S12 methylthiotransferase accessory factor